MNSATYPEMYLPIILGLALTQYDLRYCLKNTVPGLIALTACYPVKSSPVSMNLKIKVMEIAQVVVRRRKETLNSMLNLMNNAGCAMGFA